MLDILKSGFSLFKKALTKTTSALTARLKDLFGKPINEETFEELEKILYEADIGSALAVDFASQTRTFLRKNPEASFEQILAFIRSLALEIFQKPPASVIQTGSPLVILVVGVNGSGKTTSIAKLASRFRQEGKKVLLAAADTFRAAAIEQLDIWAKRAGVDIVLGKSGSDPSAIVFDALTAAKARGSDVVLIDTAGRLQNKTDLMHELEKIRRTSAKIIPGSPHETLLVLDASSGQNATNQAKVFHSFTPLTGIVLAKLDGSAKGGIALAIYQQLAIPIHWIGSGEGEGDLMPFDAQSYVDGLFDL